MLISNSEVESFQRCQRMHYYAFGERLAPKTYGTSLSRGIMGHHALEKYYKTFIDQEYSDELWERACSVMVATLQEDLMKDLTPENAVIAANLQGLLTDYANYYRYETQKVTILAVESEFFDEDFPFTFDFVTRDRLTSKVTILDHKFLYNFYGIGAIMYPQLTKYFAALKNMGFKVDYAEYNMIRHRPNAVEKFKRLDVTPSKAKQNRYRGEHNLVASQIKALKSLGSLEVWESRVARTANFFTCDKCSFLTLCQSDLEESGGRELLIQTSYMPNTYGYSDREGELAVAGLES